MNKKPFHGYLIMIAAIFLLVTGCTSRAVDYDQVGPKDKLIIRFSHVTGADTPKGLAAKRLKDLVESRSGGKIEVQVFPNSTLYSDEAELEELRRGDIQLIAPAITKLWELVPEAQIFDLPYLFSTQDDVRKLAEGPVGKRLNELLEVQGYKVLAVWDNGFKQITNNERMIQNPDDFKNLSFRIMSSRVLARQFDSVGAASVVLPFDELYQALEQGKVNGEENTVSNITNKRLYVTQKYLTKSDHGYLGYFVLTSKAFWDTIPIENRKLIEDTIREVTEWERNLSLEIDKKEYEYLKTRSDVRIYELNEKEKKAWRSAFYPTYEWFAKQTRDDVIQEYIQMVFTGDPSPEDR